MAPHRLLLLALNGCAYEPSDVCCWGKTGRIARRASTSASDPKRTSKPPLVKQGPQDKFKAAQAKAAKVGVENLSKEDVDGLSPAQLKELRGY